MRALVACATLAGCGVHTAPFRDAGGQVVPGSIATMETPLIGGVPQSVWFRGLDTGAPALVLLHGGPGASESALFRHHDAELERHFLVVSWEQRGTGRSFDPDQPRASLTVERLLSDLRELVVLVKHRFHKRHVVLLGHSWGTVLGALYATRHPEDVAAWVAVAPVADPVEGSRRSWEFALAEARHRGDRDAIAALLAMGPRPTDVDRQLRLGALVDRFGGLHRADLDTGRLILSALATDEANLVDLVLFGRGNRFSLESLWDEMTAIAPRTCCRSFAMPVFFLVGRGDRHVPSDLAAEYFAEIAAPRKELVWFEHSGHDPPFEEPAEFVRLLVERVRPLVIEPQIAAADGPHPAIPPRARSGGTARPLDAPSDPAS